MNHSIVVMASVLLLSGCSQGEWEIKTKKSEMTDEVVHTLGRHSTEKFVLPKTALRSEEESFRPWFAIRVLPGRGYYYELFTGGGLDHRGEWGEVAVRLDDEPAVRFPAREVNGKTWVYRVRASDGFLRNMLDAKKMLRIEYTTLFEGTRVVHFPLEGFRPKLEALCDQFKRECAL
ncbi:hypothetical protein [Anaeromyxobacter sp. SG26]|uniref:hypothetical protein n=1 Tax=Anaeromyxobacter sp. SG26 TaxID=2925407 RepID=UPI001F57A727|nr:hypothetical protein [Anaeromyxobacter sp. SG26]